MTGDLVRILLIEDNEVDVEAIQRGFHKRKIANPITVAGDGAEGLELLRKDAQKGGIERPLLVLLDLNLPKMSGIEFLTELRSDPELKKTIVFVLTTSKLEEDRVSSYNLNVAGYMLKSNVGDEFLKLTEMLDRYWRVIEFPPETR